MSISDVLSQAVDEIIHCLIRDNSNYEPWRGTEWGNRMVRLLQEMDAMRTELDQSPSMTPTEQEKGKALCSDILDMQLAGKPQSEIDAYVDAKRRELGWPQIQRTSQKGKTQL